MKNTLINTPSMKKAALSLAILLSFCLVFGVACGSNVQTPSGALPIWHTGDTWTTMGTMPGVEITSVVQTVTGEQVFNGIDCYTFEQTSTGMPSMTSLVDKTTFQPIEFKISSSVTVFSYDYSVKPYPLSVGKTWTVIINTTSTYLDQTTTLTDSSIYEVEKVESITVPAGTFQCFKIVRYNSSTNAVTNTRWVTDVTEGVPVKYIDNLHGATTELVSYSLSK
jgi:hypothetical protein